ncbi:MAG: FG-GAP repeat domain-containing protein [Planctomycetota bacterium]
MKGWFRLSINGTRAGYWFVFCAVLCSFWVVFGAGCVAEPVWTSPKGHRILLRVDSRWKRRSNSPASIELDFVGTLADLGVRGTFDEDTIEVTAYDSGGGPRVYDCSRVGCERYQLPWRLDKYYGINKVSLNFVLPDHRSSCYAVYFDTVESGKGKPERYRGLVGDGDYFSEGYHRRGIGATKMDAFCDLDGDGDLDLFKMTTEPFIYCHENVGGNRYVEQGRLTSGGELFVLPYDGFHRSWATLEFDDWDNDGDEDLFVGLSTGRGGYMDQFVVYENTTTSGGLLAFTERGLLKTVNGNSVGCRWFAAMKVADWDGDGRKDILASYIARQGERSHNEFHNIKFYRNMNRGKDLWNFSLAEGEALEAGGKVIDIHSPDVECADIDGDGDLDLFAATQNSKVYLYENLGSRTNPILASARDIDIHDPEEVRGGGHSGITVADFDGDGLLDYVIGHLWRSPPEVRYMYKHVGSPKGMEFIKVDVYHGAPYTEQFQRCYVGRQNVVRAFDWDNDGNRDLIATFERVKVNYFRNLGNHLFPVFMSGEELMDRETEGCGRIDICDWNNDGKKDLLAANQAGHLTLFVNEGTDAEPVFGKGERIFANERPIDGTRWTNVLICDWDNDGKKDVIFGMGGEGVTSAYYDWPHQNPNHTQDRGFLFYKNIGSDSEPQLTYPKWIEAGGEAISYTRPNVGSFVDWDGDGKKDFIGCEFENIIRFYRNVGSGEVGSEPLLADGVTIVEPWTAMLVSGACAVDWNSDGDIDIVTGQGHGGDSLRFFERDYIDDMHENSRPVVKVWRVEVKED